MTGNGVRSLCDVPEDVCFKIASFLDVGDRASLAQTAKKFRHVMDHGKLKLGNERNPIERRRSFVRFSNPAVAFHFTSSACPCVPL